VTYVKGYRRGTSKPPLSDTLTVEGEQEHGQHVVRALKKDFEQWQDRDLTATRSCICFATASISAEFGR